MKKILSLVLSFLIASSAFAMTAGAVDFANPKFEEIYNEIGWDADYSEDRVLVVIDMEKHDRNDVLTAEDFPDVALSGVRAIWVGDKCQIYAFYLANPGRDEVRAVIEALAPYEIVESATPNYYSYPQWETSKLIGDINEDGKINLKDACIIIKHIAGYQSIAQEKMIIADCNMDNCINLKDVQFIIKYTAGFLY